MEVVDRPTGIAMHRVKLKMTQSGVASFTKPPLTKCRDTNLQRLYQSGNSHSFYLSAWPTHGVNVNNFGLLAVVILVFWNHK